MLDRIDNTPYQTQETYASLLHLGLLVPRRGSRGPPWFKEVQFFWNSLQAADGGILDREAEIPESEGMFLDVWAVKIFPACPQPGPHWGFGVRWSLDLM